MAAAAAGGGGDSGGSYIGKSRRSVGALFTACYSGGQSTVRGRIKITGREGHILEDCTGVAGVVGKNGAFAVGNTVLCGIDKK